MERGRKEVRAEMREGRERERRRMKREREGEGGREREESAKRVREGSREEESERSHMAPDFPGKFSPLRENVSCFT